MNLWYSFMGLVALLLATVFFAGVTILLATEFWITLHSVGHYWGWW